MTEYLSVILKLVCAECEETVPVNGPLLTATCARCGAANDIPASEYKSLVGVLNSFREEVARGTRVSVESFERESLAVLRLQAPQCRVCRRAVPTDNVPAGQSGTLTCECGEAYLSTPPPSWLKEIAPRVVQCVESDLSAMGLSPGVDPVADANVQGARPVVMSCPGCGGPLSVGAGAERSILCEHCGNQLEVPEVLWQWLHPLPQAHPWFLRLEAADGPNAKAEVAGVSVLWYLVVLALVLGAVGGYFALR